jgi:2-keto-4-pentenoate hydratase
MNNTSSAQRIATALLDARSSGAAANLPADFIETIDVATGLAAQELTLKALNRPFAAWKVAVAPDGVVLAAPILDNLFFPAGARIPLSLCGDCGMECEIAFRIARDMTPRTAPYSTDDIVSNIENACVTVELLHSRLPTKLKSPRGAALADLLANAALIAGVPTSDWRGRDLKNIAFEFKGDGHTILARQGGHPTGDPIGGVVALANHLSSRGMTLTAGTLVTTGSYNGVHSAPNGGTFQLHFDGFPDLAFSIG